MNAVTAPGITTAMHPPLEEEYVFLNVLLVNVKVEAAPESTSDFKLTAPPTSPVYPSLKVEREMMPVSPSDVAVSKLMDPPAAVLSDVKQPVKRLSVTCRTDDVSVLR